MIDTIRFRLESVPFKNLKCSEWEKHEKISSGFDGNPTESVWYIHKETGLRVGGSFYSSSWLEVSLPRLYYGSNGYLLRPKDINPALSAAFDLAGSVVEVIKPEKLTRYDLCHHFLGDAKDYVCSLRGLKHKRVRRVAVEWFESGLEWPGTNVFIRLYDKNEEMNKSPGEIQRLEFQIRKSMLRNIWSLEEGLNPEKCFKQYRELCSEFATRSVPRIGSVSDFLCWLKAERVMINGIDPVERFLASKSRASRYRIEKDLNTVRLEFFDAKFSSQLPDNLEDLQFVDCIPVDDKKKAVA